MARVVYSNRYDIGFFGFEKVHPFDSKKYGRAWRLLRQHFGADLNSRWIRTDRQANRRELGLVHPATYLERLRDSEYVANALELPFLSKVPNWLINWCVLRPMRWATRGTILAAESCLEHGLAINLSGGYHHAKPNQGEGFCIYNDIAIAVGSLRRNRTLAEDSRVVYVDTDAHQGNGVCHAFMNDSRVFIFDIYNSIIYPMSDTEAQGRVDCSVRVTNTCTSDEYLRDLQLRLPGFLDSVTSKPVEIAIYNAGTDVLVNDPLGDLNVSYDAVLQRDQFVIGELRKRDIPTMMLTSGGYTDKSHELIAKSAISLLEQNY